MLFLQFQAVIMKIKEIFLLSLFLSPSVWAIDLLPDVAVAEEGQTVLINIPQTRLFLFNDGNKKVSYPVATGKKSTQTPLGSYTVTEKRYKPTWYIPLSIQKEEAAKGMPKRTQVPPGPNNPLGPVFTRIGDPSLGLGIHGTNAPSSVPGWRSHGCIRMKSENALKFANLVTLHTPVKVIYQRFALNEDDGGNLWLGVYANPYAQKNDDYEMVLKAIEDWSNQRGASIDLDRMRKLLKTPTSGRCLTCAKGKHKVQGNLYSLSWTDGSAEIRRAVSYVDTNNVAHNIQDGEEVIDRTQHEGLIDAAPNGQQSVLTPSKTEPLVPPDLEAKPAQKLKPTAIDSLF